MAVSTRSLDRKYRALQENLRDLRRVVVAFSGGVDSTLVLRVARDVLGENVLAVTARSATTAAHEQRDALRLAADLGADHVIVDSHELEIPQFASNPSDKCYICKKSRFTDLLALARERGFSVVVDGENADDHDDYRPGIRATRELGVRSPLREVGLTKREIRTLSRRLGLTTWNKPPYACLATRIPYGSTITPEKLKQVDEAEDVLRELFPGTQVRVRHHGDLARIEIEPRTMAKLVRRVTRRALVDRLRQLGFTFVSLDLEGYTMGSLNRTIDTGS